MHFGIFFFFFFFFWFQANYRYKSDSTQVDHFHWNIHVKKISQHAKKRKSVKCIKWYISLDLDSSPDRRISVKQHVT